MELPLKAIVVWGELTLHLGTSHAMNFDKLLHFTAYFSFGLISFFASKTQREFFVYLGLGFVLGIAVEFAQTLLTTSRQAEILDQLANTAGLVFAYFISLPIHSFIEKKVNQSQ